MNAIKSLLLTSLFLCAGNVFAQSVDKEPEPAAIVELGGAAGQDFKGGESSFGGDFAVEFTPIENWLEIEAGATPLFRRHSTEWDTDLLFKKPWTLSEKVEFMLGVGPEWIHTRAYGLTTNAIGGEVVLDFMFWPSLKRRFGWFLEPGYDYSFARGHERSIGISGGLLISIPRRRYTFEREVTSTGLRSLIPEWSTKAVSSTTSPSTSTQRATARAQLVILKRLSAPCHANIGQIKTPSRRRSIDLRF